MKGLLRANMRHHGRRYVATMGAVAIAVAFIMLALSFAAGMGAGAKKALIGEYENIDVAVVADPDADLFNIENYEVVARQVQDVDGVKAVAPKVSFYAQVAADDVVLNTRSAPDYPGFVEVEYAEGERPHTGQVSVDRSIADALKLSVGDTIAVDNALGGEDKPLELTVSGIYGTGGLITMSNNQMLMNPADFDALVGTASADAVLIKGNPDLTDAQQQKLADAVAAALGTDTGLLVQTKSEVIDAGLSGINMDMASMNMVVMVFPLIAAIVAIIVVGTTFQVIVQQRLREMALLRCLGATPKQVRRLILGESAAVGAVASAIGVVAGGLLGALVIWLVGLVPTFVTALDAVVTWTMLWVFLLGVVITVISGIRPALKVGRIEPIQALSNADVPAVKRGVGWWARLIIGAIMAVGAGAVMVWQAPHQTTASFGMAFVSGIVSLIGLIVLLSAAFPWFVAALAYPLRGVTGRMARGNLLRNPGRTAATGVSVVIGVSLIVTMMVGAYSLRQTMDTNLDRLMPTDVVITTHGDLSATQVDEVSSVPGVAKALPLRMHVWSGEGEPPVTANGESTALVDIDALVEVARTDITAPDSSQVAVNLDSGYESGDEVELCGENTCQKLTALPVTYVDVGALAVTSDVFDALAPDAPIKQIVAQLTDVRDHAGIVADIQRVDSSFSVSGAAPMRAEFENIITIVLAVVVGLLAVSVLVALVGVSNTLSLSVVERTRENGLLRALGMTRRQVSRLLTVEALVISLVGALLGIAAGIFFGAIGMTAIPADFAELIIAVPWLQITIVLVVAVVAAVIASWLPGRRASQVSPVEALATD